MKALMVGLLLTSLASACMVCLSSPKARWAPLKWEGRLLRSPSRLRWTTRRRHRATNWKLATRPTFSTRTRTLVMGRTKRAHRSTTSLLTAPTIPACRWDSRALRPPILKMSTLAALSPTAGMAPACTINARASCARCSRLGNALWNHAASTVSTSRISGNRDPGPWSLSRTSIIQPRRLVYQGWRRACGRRITSSSERNTVVRTGMRSRTVAPLGSTRTSRAGARASTASAWPTS
mmetsp:Transcript_18493/g.51089  ORF Transcript_18493/g.51089 Transcript_18493/m.51089 type:complete len:236 (-) Transcript_18493:2758-3465(-)